MQESQQQKAHKRQVVMSGMRPTGRLHLGHYLGVLKNWVTLQDQYDCFFSVADWHALTTKYDATSGLVDTIYDVVLDWLGAGVDPDKATIYIQSTQPEIAELHLLLSMFTPNKWVETDPTLKDLVATLHEDLSYGLLGYPVLQTADILGVRASLVPVGEDQAAHLEITRDIARRFNHLFKTDLFPEPKTLLTKVPKVIGLDGRKMSKSYNNSIYLSDSEEDTLKIIKTAVTDIKRVKRDDPGTPEDCQAVFPYYNLFGSPEQIALAAEECRTAKRGCMDCKKILAELINAELGPLRERRALYASDRAQMEQIIRTGCEKARDVHADTLRQVRQTMKMFQPGCLLPAAK